MIYNRIFALDGYDPFINYVKGICIFFVILAHNFPYQNETLFSLWGAQAVPCFLLIQVFHVYKKGILTSAPTKIGLMVRRIFLPFLTTFLLSFLILCLLPNNGIASILKSGIAAGGYGPGAYYVWIYLQFVILIVMCRKLFAKYTGWKLLMVFVLLSSLLELACYYASLFLSNFALIYRLSFFRYFFLIYLGYMLVMNNNDKPIKLIILNSVSIVFILLFQYSNIELEPLFYNNDWKISHWITYFYTFSGFLYLLKFSYKHIWKYPLELLQQMGKYSYEIFLCQMFVFTFFKIEYLSFSGAGMQVLLYIIFTTILSIFPILFVKKYLTAKIYRNR